VRPTWIGDLQSTTIDINYVNVIDFIDQSIKIDITTLLAITVIDFIDWCRPYMSLMSGIDFAFKRRVIAVK